MRTLVPYAPEDSTEMYEDYYDAQVGQGLSVYKGKPMMTGNGIGSIFSGLVRSALPMLKRGAKSVGKKLLTTAAGVAGDVLSGENLKKSASNRFRTAGADLLDDVEQTLRTRAIPSSRASTRRARTTATPAVKKRSRPRRTGTRQPLKKQRRQRQATIFDA